MLKREFTNDGIECGVSEIVPIVVELESSLKAEQYRIVASTGKITLSVSTLNGYIYAMETLFQLIDNGKLKECQLDDEPLVQHRGIMIDSVRHFLSVAAIKRTLEAMPVSKLNKLHWHLVDDEAFPFETVNHPELSLEGAYDKKSRYTISEIKNLIAFAKQHAVTIIPEVDTPAHTRSWGLSSKWKAQNITIQCPAGEGYNGQLDVSKDVVYTLVKDVL
jgi:N-acetyl-beta-hexosaminidase